LEQGRPARPSNVDRSNSTCDRFMGQAAILVGGRQAYELDYHGGPIVS
jgi:hypothetical protein